MKQSSQSRKLNEAVRQVLADILMYQIADPRLASLTVSAVQVSRDRAVAKCYIRADRISADEALAGLESAKGRIRSLLAGELTWRVTPELRFEIDDSHLTAARITEALKAVPATLSVPKDDFGYPLITTEDSAEEGQLA